MGSSRTRNSNSATGARSVQKSSKRRSKPTKLRNPAEALRAIKLARSPQSAEPLQRKPLKGERKTKTQKKLAHLEKKKVAEFDDVQVDILDSYSLILIGYNLLLESSNGKNEKQSHAIIALTHGVKLLEKASGQLDEAASHLRIYCSQCGVEHGPGGES